MISNSALQDVEDLGLVAVDVQRRPVARGHLLFQHGIGPARLLAQDLERALAAEDAHDLAGAGGVDDGDGCLRLGEENAILRHDFSPRSRSRRLPLVEVRVVRQDQVRRAAGVISREVDLLRGEVNRPIRPHGLIRRQSFLGTGDRPLQRRLPTAIDPHRQIEVSAVGSLEQVRPLRGR